MKKTIILALGIFWFSLTFASAQCNVSVVQIVQPSIQSGFLINYIVGVNTGADAQIWVQHRSIFSDYRELWYVEPPATLPDTCTGFIYAHQKDTALMLAGEIFQFQGFLLEGDTLLYQTAIKSYMKPPGKRYIPRSPFHTLKEMGINPTVIINADALKNAQGVVDFSNLRFGTGDDEIETDENSVLDEILFGKLGNGFSIKNPLQLPLKVSVFDTSGKMLNIPETIESTEYRFSSPGILKAGLYLIKIDYKNSSRTEKLFIL